MSKETAAAILVQTMFTTDVSMQHLLMSHAKLGNAEPETLAKFIEPYYAAMLQAMNSEKGDLENKENASGVDDAEAGQDRLAGEGESRRTPAKMSDDKSGNGDVRGDAAKKAGG